MFSDTCIHTFNMETMTCSKCGLTRRDQVRQSPWSKPISISTTPVTHVRDELKRIMDSSLTVDVDGVDDLEMIKAMYPAYAAKWLKEDEPLTPAGSLLKHYDTKYRKGL